MKMLLAVSIFLISTGSLMAETCEDGDAAHEARDYAGAVAAYDDCFDANEMADPTSYHRRGRSHMKQGAHDLAMADFDQALELDEEHAGALNSRAWLNYLSEDLEAASADIEAAMGLEPDNERFLDTYAHILAASGDPEGAMEAFDVALRNQSRDGVRKTQNRLVEAGFNPGPVDGLYGPRTRSALEDCASQACRLWP